MTRVAPRVEALRRQSDIGEAIPPVTESGAPPEYASYYGQPILNPPVWQARDIGGYLFLGGGAGASSLLAIGAELTRRTSLARIAKLGAAAAASLSIAALVHDLGRPERFVNMLRVVKPTSPMSVGSWVLAAYVPATSVAALCDLTGRRAIGRIATGVAAGLGPIVASYTAVLLSDTAVPAWHEGYRELPFMFVGSAGVTAGGLGLVAAPLDQNAPAQRMMLAGVVLELAATHRMKRRLGVLAEPYERGRAGHLMRAGTALAAGGAALALIGRKSRIGSAVAGSALVVASACTRLGVFFAGMHSASDPKYVVASQTN
jgi:DMSO reductase anchor subunit